MSSPEPIKLDLGALLEHSSWLRGLARRLVLDPQRADDLVQQTWVAALERPPRAQSRQRAWLGSVVRRLAARTYRTEARRATREEAASRPEAVAVAAEELVERAELQQEIARLVLELDEPYRTSVLLRFYEDLSSAEAAHRLGVPVATVRTRIRRALEQIRARLDHAHGDRTVWGSLVLPIASLDPKIATASSFVTASASTSASLAMLITSIGGVIMAKASIVFLLVGAAALGIGFWWGKGVEKTEPPIEPAVTEAEYQQLSSEKAELETRLAALEAANTELESAKSRLEVEVAEAKKAALPTEEALVGEALAIAFGDYASIPELRENDWQSLAAAIIEIDDEVVKLEAALAAGESPDPKAQLKIMEQQARLEEYALDVIGKLPTRFSGNGEFSHPISVANMVSAYLDVGERPLSDRQRQEIAVLGEEYNREFEEQGSRYDESTYKLEELLDEVALKHDFVNRMYDSLDPDQADFVVRSSIRGRASLDTFSPAVMLAMKAQPLSVDSPAQLRQKLVEKLAEQFPDHRERMQTLPLFDDWVQDVESILEPQPRYLHGMFKADEATVAGYAQVRALKALALELGLSEDDQRTLRTLQFMVVPRLNPTP